MKRILCLLFIFTLMFALLPTGVAAAKGKTETVDVIILAEGSTDGLVAHIQSLGGTINFQYRNVNAVAASIPVDQMSAVSSFSGVTKIEKDRMVYLTDQTEVGDDPHFNSYMVEDMSGVNVEAVSITSISPGDLPDGYANFLYTGAFFTWAETFAGEGTIVAIVDTGTVPNFCLGNAVIGAPGFPDGYNATPDGIAANDPANHWHGTHVGGVIASDCALDFSAVPTHPIYLAQAPYLGWPVDFVPIIGQAPSADLYPVKVFPASGEGVPSSVILDGLDHILTLKKDGVLDIDIVNMSLGGPTLWDGRDSYDRFLGELSDAGILVVTSAGNEGPILNSIGSPGTSYDALSVGALDYAPSSRTLYEYIGLTDWPGTPGMGMVMRPTDEVRVVNFSSRGPLSDGRSGPEIVALGHWNFQEGPNGELRWAGGTSFSSPTVAGGAALLNAYWEGLGYETDPEILENVLKLGADPGVVGSIWQGINDQGYGTLDIPGSLDLLMDGDWKLKKEKKSGDLEPTILGKPVKGKVQTWESNTITLDPSEPFNAVIEIGQWTSNVTIEVFDIVIPDNWDYAYWANALEIHVQSAKRTSFSPHPIGVYWYPWYGDAVDIVIEDGPWTFWDIPWTYQPMEPGLMKLSLIGDYSNEAQVSFKVRVTRENDKPKLTNRISNGVVNYGDFIEIPVEVPEGVSTATFDLVWHRLWNDFPTSDVDMILLGPGNEVIFDGATGNAPERAIIANPAAGTWTILINGYELYKPDNYDLYLTLE